MYENQSPYYQLVNEAMAIHHQATVLFNVLVSNLQRIGKLTDEWDRYFREVRDSCRNRDKLRHAHDHYRHKMYRANRRILHRQHKGKTIEDARLSKYIQRVIKNIKFRMTLNTDQLLIII